MTAKATAPTFSFSSVPVTELPPRATKGANAGTLAMGTAILAACADGSSAVDSLTFPDRAGATKRAGTLRRAVEVVGVPDGMKLRTRIYSVNDTFQVAVMLTAVEADAAAE